MIMTKGGLGKLPASRTPAVDRGAPSNSRHRFSLQTEQDLRSWNEPKRTTHAGSAIRCLATFFSVELWSQGMSVHVLCVCVGVPVSNGKERVLGSCASHYVPVCTLSLLSRTVFLPIGTAKE